MHPLFSNYEDTPLDKRSKWKAYLYNSVMVLTSNFSKILCRWVFTVFTAIKYSFEIWGAVLPISLSIIALPYSIDPSLFTLNK